MWIEKNVSPNSLNAVLKSIFFVYGFTDSWRIGLPVAVSYTNLLPYIFEYKPTQI